MKKFFTYFLTIAAVAAMTVSCSDSDESDIDTDSGSSDIDCYGVSFSSSSIEATIEYGEEYTLSITAKRNVTNDAITVPVEFDDESEGIITVSDLVFADGESESEIVLSFPYASIENTYECTLSITDSRYASAYSSNKSVSVSIYVEAQWNDLGYGTWTEGSNCYFAQQFNGQYVDVLVQQREDSPNRFRIRMRWTNDDGSEEAVYYTEGQYSGYVACDKYFKFRVFYAGESINFISSSEKYPDYSIPVTIDGIVSFEPYLTGYYESSLDGYFYYYCPSYWGNTVTEANLVNNRVTAFQDNGLPGKIELSPITYLDSGYSNNLWNKTDCIIITFPGYVDYSLELSYSESEDGEMPLTFTCGRDIATVKYQIYQGVLTDEEISLHATNIAGGSETSTTMTDTDVSINMGSTGTYTMVAVGFDSNGDVQATASLEFNYLAKGDSQAVSATITAEAAGYGDETSDNVIKCNITGSGIVRARAMVMKTTDYEAQKDTIDLVIADEDLLDDVAYINGEGGLDVYFQHLITGTEYTVVAWVSNGYQAEIFTTEASTTGTLEGLTVSDIVGTYDVEFTSIFNGPSTETWVVEASDDGDYDVMITECFSLGSQDIEMTPIYGTLEDDYTLSFPRGQYMFTQVYDGITYYCHFDNGEEDAPVVFTILGPGKFINSTAYFGIIEWDETYSSYGSWELYSDLLATRSSSSTSSVVSASAKKAEAVEVHADVNFSKRSASASKPICVQGEASDSDSRIATFSVTPAAPKRDKILDAMESTTGIDQVKMVD